MAFTLDIKSRKVFALIYLNSRNQCIFVQLKQIIGIFSQCVLLDKLAQSRHIWQGCMTSAVNLQLPHLR